jgi:hypothetical protein
LHQPSSYNGLFEIINVSDTLDIVGGESSGFVERTRVEVPGAGRP